MSTRHPNAVEGVILEEEDFYRENSFVSLKNVHNKEKEDRKELESNLEVE